MPVAAKQRSALTRKLGPLPAWAWAVTAGGAIYLYRSRSSSPPAAAPVDTLSSAPSSVNPDTGLPWNIDPATGAPYGANGSSTTAGDTTGGTAGGDEGSGGGLGGKTSSGGIASIVAGLKGKPKRPRKKKPKGPHHGHKGRPPVHHKRKKRKKGAGSTPRRGLPALPARPPLIFRRRQAKAAHAMPPATAPVSHASTGRSVAAVAAPRGRTNLGGREHDAPHARPSSPPPGGRVQHGRRVSRQPQAPAKARRHRAG